MKQFIEKLRYVFRSNVQEEKEIIIEPVCDDNQQLLKKDHLYGKRVMLTIHFDTIVDCLDAIQSRDKSLKVWKEHSRVDVLKLIVSDYEVDLENLWVKIHVTHKIDHIIKDTYFIFRKSKKYENITEVRGLCNNSSISEESFFCDIVRVGKSIEGYW